MYSEQILSGERSEHLEVYALTHSVRSEEHLLAVLQGPEHLCTLAQVVARELDAFEVGDASRGCDYECWHIHCNRQKVLRCFGNNFSFCSHKL